MAFTLNRRLAQLVDSNGQLNTGKIPNDYISSDHIADNVITSAMLHTSFTVSTSNLTAIDTDDVSEGSTNLYYTNARADARIAAATTDDLTEGSTNLYYTDARAQAVSINNVVEDTTPQLGGNLASNGNDILFADNDKAIFGTGSDLQIYHTGTESWIKDAGSGNLYIDSNGAAIQLTSGNAAKSMINAVPDGGVTLFHNNDIKLNTSSDGVTVTGNLAVTGDLDITGNVNSYNVTDLDVTDKTITLGAGQTEANSGGSGIIIDGSSASLLWDETATTWDFNNALNIDSPLDASLTLNKTSSSTWNYIQIVQQGTRNFYLGSDNTANFVFGADNSGDFYFTGGKVGINESSHDAYLHVTGKSSYTTANSSEVSGLEFIRLQPNSDSEHSLWIHNAGNNLGISGYTDAATTTIRDITLQTYGGKVGIGYDSPTHNLHIHDSSTGAGSTYIRVSREVDSSAVNRKAGIILGTRAANLGSTWRIESDSSSGYSDNARLQFIHNGGGTDANRMTLRHSGKLGIGTQSPSSYVHAALGNQALGFDAGFWASANPSDYTVGRGAGITMQNADVYTGGIYGIRENNDWTGALTFYTHTSSSSNTFGTSFTEKMRITSDGKVGIGIAPYFPLHVQGANLANGDAKTTVLFFDTTSAAAGTGGGIALGGYTNGTGGDLYHFGNIQGIKENSTAGNYDSAMIFSTRVNGATPTEKLRITSSGNVGIGDTDPDEKLSVFGAVTSSYQAANFAAGPYRANMDIIDAIKKVRIGSIQGSNTPTGSQGEVGIYVNSGEKVTIDVNGNVGIGNVSPTSNLTIGSAQADGLEFTYDGTNTYRNRISNYWNSSTDTRMDFEIGRTGGVAPTTVLSVGYGGNVGIGTNNPGEKLEVAGNIDIGSNGIKASMIGRSATNSADANINFWDYNHATFPGHVHIVADSAGSDGTYGAGQIVFWTHNGSAFNISGAFDKNGNLGIGVTDPNNKLEVDGHIGFSKNGTSGNRYLLIEGADATYAGTLNIQAGFGSTAAGGAVKLYAHSHATYPGSVWIGRSAGSSGNIMFGNGGTGPTSSSQIQMVLNSSGYLGLHGQLSPSTPIHVGTSTSVASTVTITHEDNGGFGSVDIDAYGTATLRLLSNFSGSSVNGIASGTFALMTPHNRAILFGTNGSERARVANDGMFLPGADNTYDLGSTSKRWRNLYTTDLHLSNEGKPEGNKVDGTTGNWTIQEGEEHLYIINNKSGKKYRFALEEIE